MELMELLEMPMSFVALLTMKSLLNCLGPSMLRLPERFSSTVTSASTTSQLMTGVGSEILISLVQVVAPAAAGQTRTTAGDAAEAALTRDDTGTDGQEGRENRDGMHCDLGRRVSAGRVF